jgi:hypothetical protein
MVSPSELVGWVHAVNLTMDPIAERLKFYQANSYGQGTLYVFCISPELPVHVQAIRMLIGLQELRHELSKVHAPFTASCLNERMTVNAEERAELSRGLNQCAQPCWHASSLLTITC